MNNKNKLFPTPLAKQNLKLSKSWFFDKLSFKSSKEDITKDNTDLASNLTKNGNEKNHFWSKNNHSNQSTPRPVHRQRSRSINVSFSLEEDEQRKNSSIDTDDQEEDIQNQILKAKAEARTVSAVNGDLYIDYKYVAHLPPGMRI